MCSNIFWPVQWSKNLLEQNRKKVVFPLFPKRSDPIAMTWPDLKKVLQQSCQLQVSLTRNWWILFPRPKHQVGMGLPVRKRKLEATLRCGCTATQEDTEGEICLRHFCFSWNAHYTKESKYAQPYQHLRPSNSRENLWKIPKEGKERDIADASRKCLALWLSLLATTTTKPLTFDLLTLAVLCRRVYMFSVSLQDERFPEGISGVDTGSLSSVLVQPIVQATGDVAGKPITE